MAYFTISCELQVKVIHLSYLKTYTKVKYKLKSSSPLLLITFAESIPTEGEEQNELAASIDYIV